MFVLMGKTGPVVALSRKEDADSWADRFGWTIVEIPSGDEVTPMKLQTGFMNLLQPAKPAVLKEPFVSFLAEEQTNFIDAASLKLGDKFFKSNLENYFFSIPEDQNANERALRFWTELHARGMDLQRQPGEVFEVVPKASKLSEDSPNPAVVAKQIALGTGNTLQASGDPKLQVNKNGAPPTAIDPTKPIPPGVILELQNGNPVR